jgi:hypothetical protein
MVQATCQGCWLPADSGTPTRGAAISWLRLPRG